MCRRKSRAKAAPAVQTLIEGLELTERDFASRLERFGVKKLDPLGGEIRPQSA